MSGASPEQFSSYFHCYVYNSVDTEAALSLSNAVFYSILCTYAYAKFCLREREFQSKQ